MPPEGMSLDTGVDFAARLDDPWVRHPMVQLRGTLLEGTTFDQVVIEEGDGPDGQPYQRLWVQDLPETPLPMPSVALPDGPDIDEAVEEALAEDPDTPLAVALWLSTDRAWDEASVTHAVQRGLFEGTVYDQQSWDQVRREAVEARAALAAQLIEDFLVAWPALEVVELATGTPSLVVRIDAEELEGLRRDVAVSLIESAETSLGSHAKMSRFVSSMGVQPFHDAGYLGGASADTDTAIGVIELGMPYRDHYGLRSQEYSPVQGSYWRKRVATHDCTKWYESGACSERFVEQVTETDEFELQGIRHATAVVGIVAGDTTRNQDQELIDRFPWSRDYPTGGTSREIDRATAAMLVDRSGLARDVDIVATKLGKRGAVGRAYDTFRQSSVHIPLANKSFGKIYTKWPASIADIGTECEGTTSDDRKVNAWYEDGGLSIRSAGNYGNPDIYSDKGLPVPACTMGPGASALSAFSISGLDESFLEPPNHVFQRATDSSYADPHGRRLVKMAAPFEVQSPYRMRGPGAWDMFLYGPANDDPEYLPDYPEPYLGLYSMAGTSFSAPAVTGAAAVYRDWYNSTYSSTIDSPGMLAAHLLSMGDRHGGDGGLLTEGYDAELGAGLLRIRATDKSFERTSREACVARNAWISNVRATRAHDAFQATIWWHDTDQDQGGDLTDLDLRLKWLSPWGAWVVVASSESKTSNMERVYYEPGELTRGGRFIWEVVPRGLVAQDHVCETGTRVYMVETRETF